VIVPPSPGTTRGTATATCPSGSSLLGGGGTTSVVTGTALTALFESYPSAPDTWTASGVKAPGTIGSSLVVTAYAVCSA
jgi:hypothetical protein